MFKVRKDISDYKFNASVGASVTSLVQQSPIQPFLTRTQSYFDGDDKKEAVCYVDDIYMMFNQHRLSSLGVGNDTIQAWLDSLAPKSDSLRQLRDKCSDEDLMRLCKSRYLQTPSELLAWSQYLNDNYEELMDRLERDSKNDTEASTPPDSSPDTSSQTQTE